MNPKVCILTAGYGTRMGQYSEAINKALLPLNGKAIISHIIEKFSSDTEFVIAVGYKSEQVINYLTMAHPGNKIEFVKIINIDGEGSGPGLSILNCKNLLRSSFYFVSCDTLWSEDMSAFSTEKNWLAVSETPVEIALNYCNVTILENKVLKIYDKIPVPSGIGYSFCGLAFIKEAHLFWQGLERDIFSKGEKQISSGLVNLVKESSLFTYQIDWTDVGSEEKYINEIKKSENFDFSKSNEFLYFVNKNVIKFFKNPAIADMRVKKSRLNPEVFPLIKQYSECFYSYSFQDGHTLYKKSEVEIFLKLIKWLDEKLWTKKNIDPEIMYRLCKNFYEIKTKERLTNYQQKYSHIEPLTINNQKTRKVNEILEHLKWDDLFKGEAYFIHGDLQPDNIIYDSTQNKFLLLDWRQDFAGEIEFGDIYYDFAKLWGGLYLNYNQIKENNFKYKESETHCEFVFPSHPNAKCIIQILESFITNKGFSIKKVKILVGLIYLNMSPLHQFPFDKMLHALGRQMIDEHLGSKYD